jgi:hypothetical protein
VCFSSLFGDVMMMMMMMMMKMVSVMMFNDVGWCSVLFEHA